MYDDLDTLMAEIQAGEDSLLEFKEVVFRGDRVLFAGGEGRASTAIAEVAMSMANTEGGVIVFGVSNDARVVGVAPEKKPLLEQFVVNACRDLCVPPLDPVLDWVALPAEEGDARTCLKVVIPKSRFYVHQTRDGRFLKRVGSHRMPIPPEQLGRLLAARSLLVPFEERPALGTTLDVLDLSRFSAYYERRFGESLAGAKMPVERLLGNLKLAKRPDEGACLPTNLGVLLFAETPSRWLPGAYADIAVYDHPVADGNTRDTKRIDGPIPEQIDQIIRYLQTSPLIATVSTKDEYGRTDLPSYSGTALQEAIVNALVHRDYELARSQTRVFVFPDRIEFWSPGTLHNSLTPEDLYAGCQPVRRNQHLAGFLRDYGSPLTGRSYMEARGEGFLNLVRQSEHLSGRRPELTVRGNAVGLAIFAATVGA